MHTAVIDESGEVSIPEQTAQEIAAAFVEAHIGTGFTVVNGAYYDGEPYHRRLWRFFIRCEEGPIGVIYVEPEAGQVLPWTADETRLVQEKAAFLRARRQGTLPLGEDGYIVREYARRQANSYLSMQLGLQVVAIDPVLILLDRPIWQCTIELRSPRLETMGTFGMIDVDAYSGAVIPLTDDQIQQLKKRSNVTPEIPIEPTAD